jgi:ArsR family transcriptional regulator
MKYIYNLQYSQRKFEDAMSGIKKLQVEKRTLGNRCSAEDAQITLAPDVAQQISKDIQILAHPIRLQILDLLAGNEGKMCVCDLEEALPVRQPTISHHLRLLREADLIDCERDGLWVYYFVRRDELATRSARISDLLSVFV